MASGIRFNRNNTKAFSSKGLGSNAGSVERHGILRRFIDRNTPSRVLCGTGPRVKASVLGNAVGGVHGRVVRLNKVIVFRAGLISVTFDSGGLGSVAIRATGNSRVVRASGIVLTVNRDTESAFRVLCSLGLPVRTGPFSMKTEVRRLHRGISGTRCNEFTNGGGLNSTGCGLDARLSGKQNICAFYVYPKNGIIGTSDRRGELYAGNVDRFTQGTRGSGSTLLMKVGPGSCRSSRPLTKVCLREGLRSGTFITNNRGCGTPVREISSFLGGEGSARLNSMGPDVNPGCRFSGLGRVLPRCIDASVTRNVIGVDEVLRKFSSNSTILANIRDEDSSPIEVVEGASALRDVLVRKLCPYNRNTNCTNKVVSTTISNVGYTRGVVRGSGGG